VPGILFDHIAIATARIADAPAVLVGLLGGTPAFGGMSPRYRFGQWRFRGGGRIEVLEPAEDNGFLSRFLRDRGPGVHHVTFKVPSLADTCARATALGYDIVGRDDSDPEWMEAFLHPKQALGIVVQIVETTGSGEEGPTDWTPPPGPADPPLPVTLVGLLLRARSRERAHRQWEQILGGHPDERDGVLIYRWPGSPMRLAVDIDPASDEGPLAIEYASARGVVVPGGRHPVLGTVFVPGTLT